MSDLTAKQEAGLVALLQHPKLADAARAAGTTPRTLVRWLADPEFRAAYRAARRSTVEKALGSLQAAAGEAVACLQRNLTCGKPSIEIQAARIVLELSIRGIELVDLAERIERLEEAAASQLAGRSRL